MTIDEVIAALEKAKEPSTDLDRAIADAVLTGPRVVQLAGAPIDIHMWRYPDGSVGSELRFTSSLDAAQTLIPKECPYWMAERRDTPLGPMTGEAVVSNGQLFMSNKRISFDVWGYTPALALCIAALKARQNV